MSYYTKTVLEDPKVWNIISLTIYDLQGRILFNDNFMESTVNFDHELVMSVLDTLRSFSQSNFQEEISELNFGQYRLILNRIGNLIFLSAVTLGDSVDTGENSVMHKSIKRMNRTIFDRMQKQYPMNANMNFSKMNSSFIESMVNTINNSSHNPDSVFHNIQNYEDTSNWYINSVIVLDEYGTPYVSRTYENGIFKDDPILLSGLIAAIKSFSDKVFSDSLSEIVLGKYRTLFHTDAGKLYVITIELEDEASTLNHKSQLFTEITKLFKNLINTTGFLNDMDNSISHNHHTVTTVVDALVIKTIRKGDQTFVNVYDQKSNVVGKDRQKKATLTKGERIKMDGEYTRAKKFTSESFLKSLFRKVTHIWN